MEIAFTMRPTMTPQKLGMTFCISMPMRAMAIMTRTVFLRPILEMSGPAMMHPMTMPALPVPEPADCHDEGRTFSPSTTMP